MLTLWQAEQPENATTFDRKNNIGLHHLALRVKHEQTLEQLHKQLQGFANVTIEFSPEQLGESQTKHMMCIIPGGIRLELIAPAN